MRYWMSTVGTAQLDQLVELARHAEAVGFHGITVADHLAMPAVIDSRYPYSPDGKAAWPPGTPWPDPWITLTAMGVATSRLRLATNIYLAALRDPFTVGKAIATAAALTGGRVVAGFGAGWVKEEFDLQGLDFASRGRRLDEMIAALRLLWTGRQVSHRGAFYNFDVELSPPPPAPVPIWCGGETSAAMRRAARNDGWLALPMSLERGREMLGRLRGYRAEAGLPLEGLGVLFSLAAPLSPGNLRALAGLGVADVVIMSPWVTMPWEPAPFVDAGADIARLDVKKTAMTRFAETVIARDPT